MPPAIALPDATLAFRILSLGFALFVWIMAFSEWQRTRQRDYYVIGLAFTILVLRQIFPYLFFALNYHSARPISRSFALLISSAWENLSFAILAGVVVIRMSKSRWRFEKGLIAYFGFVFLLVLEVVLCDRLLPLRDLTVWTPFVFTILNLLILGLAIAASYIVGESLQHFFRKAFWLFYAQQVIVLYSLLRKVSPLVIYGGEMLFILGASFIVLGVYHSIRDELARKTERLRELDAMKSRFLAVVSHELRTPLSSMKMSYDMLLSGKLGKLQASQRDAVSVIRRNAQRLIHMIEELLDVSRMEKGLFSLRLQRRDLTEFLRRLIQEARTSLLRRSAQLEAQLPDRPIQLWFDPDRLSQVLINLLSNADRYNREGGVIRVSLKNDTDSVEIGVQDQGCGIPAKQREKVFDSFIRATPSPSGEGGLGLGLHIAKQIVQAHGGTIYVAESSSKGTTITFTLSKRLGQRRSTLSSKREARSGK